MLALSGEDDLEDVAQGLYTERVTVDWKDAGAEH